LIGILYFEILEQIYRINLDYFKKKIEDKLIITLLKLA